MANNPTFVFAAAAAIRDAEGRLLLQQCPPHKRHGGCWEFPGGKVEAGEIPRFALMREVAEELALEVDANTMEPAGFADEPAEDGRPGVVLFLYKCPNWRGEPQALEGQRWGWFTLAEASGMDLPPMDRMLLSALSG